MGACDECGQAVCERDLERCNQCLDILCPEHREQCASCGATRCPDELELCVDEGLLHCPVHLSPCRHCEESESEVVDTELHCESHLETCRVGGERLCLDHSTVDPVSGKSVCDDHREECRICCQRVAEDAIQDGECRTCCSLEQASMPPKIRSELPDYRTVHTAKNTRFIVVRGERLLRSNELVVVDRNSMTVVERRKTGLVARITGVFR